MREKENELNGDETIVCCNDSKGESSRTKSISTYHSKSPAEKTIRTRRKKIQKDEVEALGKFSQDEAKRGTSKKIHIPQSKEGGQNVGSETLLLNQVLDF